MQRGKHDISSVFDHSMRWFTCVWVYAWDKELNSSCATGWVHKARGYEGEVRALQGDQLGLSTPWALLGAVTRLNTHT